jgi:hypothetical protein
MDETRPLFALIEESDRTIEFLIPVRREGGDSYVELGKSVARNAATKEIIPGRTMTVQEFEKYINGIADQGGSQ